MLKALVCIYHRSSSIGEYSFLVLFQIFSVIPSITTRPIPEFYSYVDAVNAPLSKMVASLFPQQHSFLNNMSITLYVFTQNLEEICREIQKLWDIE